MNATADVAPQQRLQKGFSELAAGRLDSARLTFTALCDVPAVAVDAHRGMAAVSWRLGQAGPAIDHLHKATATDPDHLEARADLALLLMLAGQAEAAIPEWERVLAARPDDADAWHNFAKLLGDLRQLARSREAFERSLTLQPDRIPTMSAYARMLAACGDHDGAESLWQRVIKLQPQVMDGYQGLAEVQFGRGHLERTLGTYRIGSEAVPTAPEMHMGLAQLLEDLGDKAGAERSFRKALEVRPGWAMALEGLLTLIRGKAEPELITQARSILEDAKRPPQDRANVGFGLGKALDAQDQPQAAFDVWRLANASRRNHVGPYDRKLAVDRVDRTIREFTAERIERLSAMGSPDERPVFVLGMPRSGTSLVEQIISAHPDATGYGELRDIARLARELPQRSGSIQRWPEALPAVDGPVLRAAADDYLASLRTRESSDASRWVDKAPLNFFHVGLIAALFPKAVIIWCQRDPRDICLSIYGENFALEQGFATDLVDLGVFYREYMRLMRHWSTVLPGRMYTCIYEDMVANPEQQARALIDAVGLPWDDACLRFYEQNRPVLTPSRWQVRQPVYGRSVGRWKKYQQWLDPLIRALGDEVR